MPNISISLENGKKNSKVLKKKRKLKKRPPSGWFVEFELAKIRKNSRFWKKSPFFPSTTRISPFFFTRSRRRLFVDAYTHATYLENW